MNPLVKEASKRIGLWIKIYRNLCRTCQSKIQHANNITINDTLNDEHINNSKKVLDNLCPTCKAKIDKILEKAK